MWNLGDEKTASLVFDELNCPINELVIEKLQAISDHSSQTKAYWKSKKCQLQNTRHRAQEQFQTKSSSRKKFEATYVPAKLQRQIEMAQEVEKIEKMWAENSAKKVPVKTKH